MNKPMTIWIWHDLYHAYVWPEDHERGVLVTSACGRHSTRTSGTKMIGAAHCLDCAEALGMELTEEEISRPKRGLGYRRGSDRPCPACEHEQKPWEPDRSVGRTTSGLIAPQSAIDAMNRRLSRNETT